MKGYQRRVKRVVKLHAMQKRDDSICSVGFGCHACELAKLFAEMIMAVKSTHQSNIHNGARGFAVTARVARFQQLLCSFDALLEQYKQIARF